MSDPITIRRATKEDCPAMYRLIVELAVFEKCPNEVTVDLEEMIQLGFGPRAIWKAYVAETTVNGEPTVVGMALFYDRYSTWKGRQLYLEDFVVTQKFRGKGVGKRLFDRVLQHARDHHYVGMMWQALDWNSTALNFYKKYSGSEFDPEWVNCKIMFSKL